VLAGTAADDEDSRRGRRHVGIPVSITSRHPGADRATGAAHAAA
jgi:hypothetical protein